MESFFSTCWPHVRWRRGSPDSNPRRSLQVHFTTPRLAVRPYAIEPILYFEALYIISKGFHVLEMCFNTWWFLFTDQYKNHTNTILRWTWNPTGGPRLESLPLSAGSDFSENSLFQDYYDSQPLANMESLIIVLYPCLLLMPFFAWNRSKHWINDIANAIWFRRTNYTRVRT